MTQLYADPGFSSNVANALGIQAGVGLLYDLSLIQITVEIGIVGRRFRPACSGPTRREADGD